MNVNFSAVVPERPRKQTDREWVAAYARRSAAARLRPYNRVLAAEAESQNAGLSRGWALMGDRTERRTAARSRVGRMLDDAALRNEIAAYKRSRRETLGLISRLQGASRARGRALRGSIARAYGDGHFDVPECKDCIAAGATEEESFLLHQDPGPDAELAAYTADAPAATGRYQRVRAGGREISR